MFNFESMESAISACEGGTNTFFDRQNFAWVTHVEALYPAMRRELDQLLTAMDHLPGYEEIQVEQSELSTDTRWKIFPFHLYGKWFNENRCPATVEALKLIPRLKAAMYSILQPGKTLPAHRGPYKGVLRYHLGLKVPFPDKCAIKVANDVRNWREGESLIFDDSHIHEAWNLGTEDRVVLFVDFSRPLPAALSSFNEMFINEFSKSDFIRKAEVNWANWEKAHGADIDRILSAA